MHEHAHACAEKRASVQKRDGEVRLRRVAMGTLLLSTRFCLSLFPPFLPSFLALFTSVLSFDVHLPSSLTSPRPFPRFLAACRKNASSWPAFLAVPSLRRSPALHGSNDSGNDPGEERLRREK